MPSKIRPMPNFVPYLSCPSRWEEPSLTTVLIEIGTEYLNFAQKVLQIFMQKKVAA